MLEELKVEPVDKRLPQYKQEWLHHFSRMEDIDTQNNSSTIDLSEDEDEEEEEDLGDH
jgi:hypothetical protein